MAFFTSAVGTLQTLVIALGAGLGIWGAINLMEATEMIIPEQMLMCDKVTHKKLIDSNLLFRKISRNLLSKMIQYNSKKIFF